MNKHELKENLRQAYEHATPDVWDAVLSDCKTQKGNIIMMTTKQKPSWFKRYAGLAACLCLMIGAFFSLMNYRANNTVDTTVSLDVNPSIEIEVNKKERVIQVIPLNQDGEAIIGNLDFSGSDLNVTVYALIGSMMQNGYLSELNNSILISVDNDDPTRSTALQARLSNEVDQMLQSNAFHASILSQTVSHNDRLHQLAEPYGISDGRARLIQAILTQSDRHSFEELANLSIHELNLLLNAETAAASNFEILGTASDKAYIGEAKAKEIALKHSGVSVDSLKAFSVSLDTDDGALIYDVEFMTDEAEYDLEIDALTGSVLDFDKEGLPFVSQPSQPANFLSADKVKEIVCTHAGVSADSVSGFKCKLDTDDDMAVYDIEFYANGFEYDYKINAVTGDVLKSEKEAKVSVANPNPTPAQPSSQMISADKAKEIALSHAGVSASSISGFKCKPDNDDGTAVYEIEFYANGFEYDYEINAITGDVLKSEKESKSSVANPTPVQPASQTISADKAKEIALSHAGVSAASISGFKCELDADNGTVVYEIEFFANGFEYDYEINEASGAIEKCEKEAKSSVSKPTTTSDTSKPSTPAKPNPSAPTTTSKISASRAKEIALSHAGVSAASISGFKCELDADNGTVVYEIEFFANGFEYDYEINEASGAIEKCEKEAKSSVSKPTTTSDTSKPSTPAKPNPSTPAPASKISADKAKETALSHAGVSAASISDFKCELDADDGMAAYEIEFYANGFEYDYKINAASGAVMKCEKES